MELITHALLQNKILNDEYEYGVGEKLFAGA